MRKIFLFIGMAIGTVAHAQQQAVHQVNFMLTFDEPKQLYTAWVVPNYGTPNYNNPDSEEKGATAQFSLKVPSGVEISGVQDLIGNWEKTPMKLGNNEYFKQVGIDTNFDYYVIGKSPIETNYGAFEADEPVALFNFKANGDKNKVKEVSILENDDSFVQIAYNKLALNVASSFYSRSGQAAKMESSPLEQFSKKTTTTSIMQRLSEKYKDAEVFFVSGEDATNTLLAFPNPTDSSITLKYFASEASDKTLLYLVDASGKELKQEELKTSLGVNTTTLDVSNYLGGNYMVIIVQPNKKLTKKIIKE